MRNTVVQSQPPSYQHDTIQQQQQQQQQQYRRPITTSTTSSNVSSLFSIKFTIKICLYCCFGVLLLHLLLLTYNVNFPFLYSYNHNNTETTLTTQQQQQQSMLLMLTSNEFRESNPFKAKISTNTRKKDDDDNADIFGNESLQATQQKHNTNNGIVRHMLMQLQHQICGTIYFPDSNSNTTNDTIYNRIATGWVKQSQQIYDTDSINGSNNDDNYYISNDARSIGIVIIQVCNEDDIQIILPVLIQLDTLYNIPFRIRSGGHHKLGYSSLLDHKYNNNRNGVSGTNSYNGGGGGVIISLSLLNHIKMIPSSSSSSYAASPSPSLTTNTHNTIVASTSNGQQPIPPSLNYTLSSTTNIVESSELLLYHSILIGPATTVRDVLLQVTVPYRYGGVIGFCSAVGEGGFILGGGFGSQSRLYGLGIDSVLSFRIVLYNGTIITSSSSSSSKHSDLHWALLGAGSGSYGIVTEINYRIHPVCDTIHGLQVQFTSKNRLQQMAHFLYHIGRMESYLPKNIFLMYDEMYTFNIGWTGRNDNDVQDGDTYLYNLVHSIMEPMIGSTTESDQVDIKQESLSWVNTFSGTTVHAANNTNNTNNNDHSYTWANSVWAAACWNGYLLPENNTIDVWNDIMYHLDNGLTNSQPYLLPDIELWGGAISHYHSNATAFPYRSAIYNVGVLLVIPTNEPNAALIFERESQKINRWWFQYIDQYLTGSYINYPMVSLLNHNDTYHFARVQWGDNLHRLVQIKQKYDPNNVFRFPMSVPNKLY